MKTKPIFLFALMLMASISMLGNIPINPNKENPCIPCRDGETAIENNDTLKIYRVNFSGKIERVKLSGYCKVEIVHDSVEYLEFLNPSNTGMPEGFSYGLTPIAHNLNQLNLEGFFSASRTRLHLAMDVSTVVRAEDYAQAEVILPNNTAKLWITANDYSKVSIRCKNSADTMHAQHIKLIAEDFSTISMQLPCVMDKMQLKAIDYAKVTIPYCEGDSLISHEEDWGKVLVEKSNANTTETGNFEKGVSFTSATGNSNNSRVYRRWHISDFRVDFLWGFLNWGDKPYNGLMKMNGSYALHTSFSSYQLEMTYYPLVNNTWHIGVGLGYTSNVFKFLDGQVFLEPNPSGVYTFNSVNPESPDGNDRSTRLVARYITLPLTVRWKPCYMDDFFIGISAIPGLGITGRHTGMKYTSANDHSSHKSRTDVSRVLHPFCLDARLSIGLPNIYLYLQMPTIPMNTGMDNDLYPIKLGVAISLGEND